MIGFRKALTGFGISIIVAINIFIILILASSLDLLPSRLQRPSAMAPITTMEYRRRVKAQTRSYVPFDSLARNTENYIGDIILYEGEIIQVSEGPGLKVVLRVNVTKGEYGFWGDTIWVNYEGPRVLEDDIVKIWGRVEGRRTYKAIFGQSITIPELTALILEVQCEP